jgi:apolipoprotein D and lipocalin family protein
MIPMSVSTRTRRLFASIGLIAFTLTAGAEMPKNPNPRADAPLTYATVDLPKYMGRWYIVAHIPYFLEKNLVASQTEYVLRDDGKVVEHFSAKKGGFDGDDKKYTFVDTPDPATGNAYWSVRFFWPIYVSQITTYVDDAYQYTLIAYKDKSLGWVYSRTPEISDAKYRELLGKFEQQGYDISQFRRVVQKPEQLGMPGFDSPQK